jgi:hypothetical protein
LPFFLRPEALLRYIVLPFNICADRANCRTGLSLSYGFGCGWKPRYEDVSV